MNEIDDIPNITPQWHLRRANVPEHIQWELAITLPAWTEPTRPEVLAALERIVDEVFGYPQHQ